MDRLIVIWHLPIFNMIIKGYLKITYRIILGLILDTRINDELILNEHINGKMFLMSFATI